MKCPACGFDNPIGMKYCGICGESLARLCPQCSFPNPRVYRYCGMCGVALEPKTDPPFTAQLPLQGLNTLLPAPTRPLRELEGERRLSTVLVADVYESTTILEKIGSEAWVELMNRILQTMEREIQRFGGEVDQFRGDGLVAFFGSSVAHEDDPERAILAGLAIQRSLKPQEIAAPKNLDIRIRIGINTGEIIRTSVGDHRQQDTGMGEAITLAARMEATAEPGTILVTDSTYQLTSAKFAWQALGLIPVKGLSYQVNAYHPLSELLEDDQPFRPSKELAPSPVVLRPVEMQRLLECVNALGSGHGGIILLTGDKGMGKSFLLKQVQDRTRAEGLPSGAEAQWITVYSRSYEQLQPFALWQDILHRWLRVHPQDASRDVRTHLHEQLTSLSDGLAAWCYPYLAGVLGLTLEPEAQELIQGFTADELQRQVFWALRSWLEALARRSPVVLVFSGVQWADATSVEALKISLSLCDTQPILFILSIRPEPGMPVHIWHDYLQGAYARCLTLIELPPLGEDHIRKVMDIFLGRHRLSGKLLQLLNQKADGNPYYVTEMLRMLVSQEWLQQDPDGVWFEARALSSVDLPESLQGLLLARIDRLGASERQLLQIAAVIGPVFWRDVLEVVIEDPLQVDAPLQGLLRAQLIQERIPTPDLGTEYVFTPSLLRDVVYESLLSTQRTQIHLRVARAIDDCIHPGSIRQYESLLAYHYQRAHQPQKELLYLLLAAEKSRNIYANNEAILHYTRALEVLDEWEAGIESDEALYYINTQRFETLIGRLHIDYDTGNLVAGRADARALIALAEKLSDDPIWKVDALLSQPEVIARDNREDLEAGVRIALEALELARGCQDHPRELKSLLVVSAGYRMLSNPQWFTLSRQALDLAREIGDLHAEVNILLEIGRALGPDRLQESAQYLDEAFQVSQKLDDSTLQIELLEALASEFERQGDHYRQLVECEQKRLALSREMGKRLTEGHALLKCGQIQAIYLGDLAGGLELVEQALQIWKNITPQLYPLMRIVHIKTQQGDLPGAQAALERASLFRERVASEIGRAGLYLAEIILGIALGDDDRLRLALENCRNLRQMTANGLISRQYDIAADYFQSEIFLAMRQKSGAETDFHANTAAAYPFAASAVKVFEEFGFIQIVECTSQAVLHQLSRLADDLGNQDQAREYAQKAYHELRRKYELIPAQSYFRRTFWDIPLHQEIVAHGMAG